MPMPHCSIFSSRKKSFSETLQSRFFSPTVLEITFCKGGSVMRYKSILAAVAATLSMSVSAYAADIEVTHWWTSGGEAAAVAEFAKAVDASGDKWVDGAIAGSGDVARPIIISRILGGNPMGATQLNPGKDADDLIAAGLLEDITDVATAGDWAKILRPKLHSLKAAPRTAKSIAFL
jgi:ABC-type glycerol-3-phosphate transport system substrate-binding protein